MMSSSRAGVVGCQLDGGSPVGRDVVAVDANRDAVAHRQDDGYLGSGPGGGDGVASGLWVGFGDPVAAGPVALAPLAGDQRTPGVRGFTAEPAGPVQGSGDIGEAAVSYLVHVPVGGRSR
jgi:hypothetical protein